MAPHEIPGRFELLVLTATVSLRGKGYAVTIREWIETHADRAITRGAVYTTLARLETKGLIRSTMGDPTPMRGGRPKRYYELTPAGAHALRSAREELTTAWRGLARLLGPSTTR